MIEGTTATDDYADLTLTARPAPGLALGLGLLTALASIGAAAAALSIQWQHPVTPVLVSVATLGLGFVVARFILGFVVAERRSAVAALTLVGVAPLLGSAAAHQLLSGAALGTGLGTARVASVVALAISGFLVVGVLAASLARRLEARFGVVVRVAAVAAAVGCVALLGHVGAARLGIYAAASPAPRQVATMAAAEVRDGRFFEEVPAVGQSGASLFSLGRCCVGNRCFAYVRHGETVRVIGPRFAQGARIELLHSAWRNELTLLADGRLLAVASDDLANGEWTEPTAATAARLHLPASFALLALAGLGGALLLWAGGFGLRRKLGRVVAARAGLARGNGWLEVEGDGTPRRALCEVEPGPVLLLDETRADAHAYRGDCRDQTLNLVAGRREPLAHQLRQRIATADALIVGWTVPLCAPAATGVALVLLG